MIGLGPDENEPHLKTSKGKEIYQKRSDSTVNKMRVIVFNVVEIGRSFLNFTYPSIIIGA